jgi:hypothetical protein
MGRGIGRSGRIGRGEFSRHIGGCGFVRGEWWVGFVGEGALPMVGMTQCWARRGEMGINRIYRMREDYGGMMGGFSGDFLA